MIDIKLTDEQFNELLYLVKDAIDNYDNTLYGSNLKNLRDIYQIAQMQEFNSYTMQKRQVPCIRPLLQLIRDLYYADKIKRVKVGRKIIQLYVDEIKKPKNLTIVREYAKKERT